MDNFENVDGLTHEQQLRAWSVEKASEILTTGLVSPRRNSVVSLADKIGSFVSTGDVDPVSVEQLCEVMHDAYEKAAVGAGWETQEASRKKWADVPEANKITMREAVKALLNQLGVKF